MTNFTNDLRVILDGIDVWRFTSATMARGSFERQITNSGLVPIGQENVSRDVREAASLELKEEQSPLNPKGQRSQDKEIKQPK